MLSIGTGKTRTLVAAIVEIILTTDNCVLVCTCSNSACDEITERLLDLLPSHTVFRMYAKSFSVDELNEKIRPVSNLIDNEFQLPSLTYLYQFRVIICTVQMAGCITRARENNNFRSNHFSHVIFDEAACVPQSVSLVAIAGMYDLSSDSW